MDARERWLALQARLIAAGAAIDAGDRATALAEVAAALDLDPDFLAAHSLRNRILAAEAEPAVPAAPFRSDGPEAAASDSPAPPTEEPIADPAAAVSEPYARFEQRARRRRVDRRVEAARAALDRRRLRNAEAALAEIAELDPNLPDLAELTARFEALRDTGAPSRYGEWLAASVVFAGSVLCASSLYDPVYLFPRPIAVFAPLVDARIPMLEPPTIDTIVEAHANVESKPQPDLARRAEPLRVALPASAPVVGPLPAVAEPPPLDARVAAAPRPIAAATSTGPAPAPTAAAAPAPALPPAVDDERLVTQVLQRYRSAYEGLDARSAQAVWPAVNEAALARAFSGLESQMLTFDACDVRVLGESASATCRGSARYQPKVGSREPRIEPRVWTFTLRKAGADWTIERARAER